MGAKSIHVGEAMIMADSWQPYTGDNLGTGPGMWVDTSGPLPQVMAIKAPHYRPADDRHRKGVFKGDAVAVTSAIFEQPYSIGTSRQMGVEVELNVVDISGMPADLYPHDKPLHAKLGDHPELFRNTWEMDEGPAGNAEHVYAAVAKEIGAIALILTKHHLLIDPASARMQDKPNSGNVTPNAYVRAVVDQMGHTIYSFIGHGVHEHHEMHVGYLPVVSRYLRVLAPLLNVGLQAAPFAFGEHAPRLGQYMDNAELRAHDGQQPHSTRYLTRFAASASGGVGLRVAHDTLDEMLTDAHSLLQTGAISNPARVYGAHTDVRPRLDSLPGHPEHPGRVELCVKDTAALRFETLTAYGNLSRAVVDVLEEVAAGGDQAVMRLHQEFPALFGRNYDKHSFGRDQLERTHRNSVAIAYDGNDAQVEDALGRKVSVQQQFTELLRLVEGHLSRADLATLSDSLLPPSALANDFAHYTDAQGLPSLEGYYITGRGTAADWMIARNKALEARGDMNEQQRMRDGTLDRTRAFAAYIMQLTAA